VYVGYPLSLRNVEDLLFERGVAIRHETVRPPTVSDFQVASISAGTPPKRLQTRCEAEISRVALFHLYVFRAQERFYIAQYIRINIIYLRMYIY
jgi:hypothetical protein